MTEFSTPEAQIISTSDEWWQDRTENGHSRFDGGSERSSTAWLPAMAIAAGLAAWEITARRNVPSGEPFATIKRSVAIDGAGADPYPLISDPERLSVLLGGPTVEAKSPNRWTWVFDGPAGLKLPLETTTVDARPGRHISWRAGKGSLVPHDVTIDLFPAPDGGETIIQAVLNLYPSPGLPLGLTGKAVRFAADRTLATLFYQLRALIETGEMPMVTGQPSGNPADKGAGSGNTEETSQELMRVVYGGEDQEVPGLDVEEPDALVEEASEESFPASDPPSYTRTAPLPSKDAPTP